MTQSGQLTIKGTLDISAIKQGQREVNVGFEVMKQKTQSTFGSMEMLRGSAAGLGSSLAKVSGLALTGLTGLAGLTPTLAGEFAKFKVETFKLAQVVGQELKPAFEGAVQSYGEFVSFLEGGSPLAELTKDVGILAGSAGIALIGSQLLGLPKALTIGVSLLITSKYIEDEVEKATDSEIAGDVAGGLLNAVGGALIASTLAGLAGLGSGAALVVGGIGALVGGASKAFEVGVDTADSLIELVGGTVNQSPYTDPNRVSTQGEKIYNNTKDEYLYDVSTT